MALFEHVCRTGDVVHGGPHQTWVTVACIIKQNVSDTPVAEVQNIVENVDEYEQITFYDNCKVKPKPQLCMQDDTMFYVFYQIIFLIF